MSMLFAGIGEFFNQDCFFLGGMEKEIQEKKKKKLPHKGRTIYIFSEYVGITPGLPEE